MRILVAGGLGFIGHNVVVKLESIGHEVSILDIEASYNLIPQQELVFLLKERKEKIATKDFYYGKITDNLEGIFEKHQPEIVINLASYPRQKAVAHDPIDASMTMITGLVNLCQKCLAWDAKLIHISSSMVYGDFCGTDRDEESGCLPQNMYGILKLAGEDIIKDYAKKGLNYTILRPSAVYGPGDVSDRVIAKFILSAMNDGELIVEGAKEELDFTHVEDASNGIVLAALSENTHGKIYNITRGHARRISEAAKMVTQIVGKGKLVITPKNVDFPSRGTLNIDAARRDFNFDPQINIKEGIEGYYRYFHDSLFWNQKTV